MFLSSAQSSPVDKLILNDIGPIIPQNGIYEIFNKIKKTETKFNSLEDAIENFKIKYEVKLLLNKNFAVIFLESWN